MKTSIICLFALSSIFTNAAVFADESGSGKPTTNTQSATTSATSTDCPAIKSWLGLCEVSSESSDVSE